MVSLKWGDVLSILPPGALVVFAVSQHVELFGFHIQTLGQITVGTGTALLIFSVLAGGILAAITRVSWERWLIRRCHVDFDVLGALTAGNLALYERGVQSSYKYVTFYANFAWAILVLLASLLVKTPSAALGTVLTVIVAILLRASYVQWTYFVNYQTKVFKPVESENAKE